jgi:hypothetical protein
VLAAAAARPAPVVTLPDHLVTSGDRVLLRILDAFALPPDVWRRNTSAGTDANAGD